MKQRLKCARCTKNEVLEPGACATCRAELDSTWKRMVKWAKKRGYYRRERKLKGPISPATTAQQQGE